MSRSGDPRRLRTGRAALRIRAGALGLLVLWVGCSTTQRVALDDFPEDGTGRARVSTADGYTYDFARVAVRGDSLIGTYLVVEERVSASGDIAFVDVARHTLIPLSQVTRVEVRRIDPGGTLLMGAGAVLFTIWARSVIEPDEPEEADTGGGGKPPP